MSKAFLLNTENQWLSQGEAFVQLFRVVNWIPCYIFLKHHCYLKEFKTDKSVVIQTLVLSKHFLKTRVSLCPCKKNNWLYLLLLWVWQLPNTRLFLKNIKSMVVVMNVIQWSCVEKCQHFKGPCNLVNQYFLNNQCTVSQNYAWIKKSHWKWKIDLWILIYESRKCS